MTPISSVNIIFFSEQRWQIIGQKDKFKVEKNLNEINEVHLHDVSMLHYKKCLAFIKADS